MQLQGRNLSLRLQGADVQLLHTELTQLGLTIPPDEREAQLFGPGTERAVQAFQVTHELAPTGIVDLTTALAINLAVLNRPPRPEPPPEFVVQGTLQGFDAAALAGATVVAVDRDVRREERLGTASVDDEHRYRIPYTAAQILRAERGTADLVVRAVGADGRALASSAILFNAPRRATIDLVAPAAPPRVVSEIERYHDELRPLLDDLTFDQLTEDEAHQDISFLAGESGIHPRHIAFIATAHRHARTIALPPEALYAAFRQNLPTTLAGLVLQRPERIRRAIERSVADNIVPAWVGEQVEGIIRTLMGHTRDGVLTASGGATFRLGQLMTAAQVSPELQEKFVALCRRNDLTGPSFWQAVRSDPDLARDGAADALEFAMQAGVLTLDNVPLVAALANLRRQGTVGHVRDLVKLSQADWESRIRATGAPIPPQITGDSEALRISRYAEMMTEAARLMFPTAAIAERAARAPVVDSALISGVLTRNPRLDPREALPDTVEWGELDPAAREQARSALDQLRREANTFPQLDPRAAVSSSGLVNPYRRDLAHFLANAKDFDFETTHIERFLAEPAAAPALEGVSDRAALANTLKQFQRVSLFASHPDHMSALMGGGVHSAFAFASIPLKNAIRDFAGPMGGEMHVRSAHANAAQKTSVTTTLAGSIQHGLHDSLVAAGGGGVLQVFQKIPSLATLFGSEDLCECAHCRSVYGPAAYFVDLLQFLRKSSQTPLARLTARRPDLPHIQLTCENSDVRLPYLDLVNEILESYVAHEPNGLDATTAKNTTPEVTPEELSVNPQYTIDEAYEKLRGAVHGVHLPFNRPIQVARAYLEHLGSSRHDVLSTFQTHGTPIDPSDPNSESVPATRTPSDSVLAREYLRIAPEAFDIIADVSAEPTWRFFGYSSPEFVDDTWTGNLSRVPAFLRRTGITYDDLVALLRTRYVNPVQTPDPDDLPPETVVLFAPNSACDLEVTRITRLESPLAGLGDAAWRRMHRFLRLWQTLGWTMAELDGALHALNVTNIDAAVVDVLACMQRLRDQLRQPLAPLLVLWAPLGTFDARFQGRTLYHSLFLNRAVINDPSYTVFALNADGTELADASAPLEAHVTAVQGALRVSAEELTLLRQATALDGPQAVMTLAALSLLYRHAFLARALKLKIRDYIALAHLMGVDLPTPAIPADTVRFVDRVHAVKRSPFTAAQLTYLFRHLAEAPSTAAPSPRAIVVLLEQLQQGLRRVLEETALVPDPAGELLHDRLAMLLDAALVGAATGIIDRSSELSASEQDAFVDQHFALFLPDLAEAKAVLFAPLSDPSSGASTSEVAARRDYVYPRLTAHLRDFLSRSLVKQTLADALKLEGADVQLLLETVLRSRVDASMFAMHDFLALVGDGLSASYFPNTSLTDPPALTRVEPTVSAYFGDGSPDLAQVPPGAFSARWTGFLLAQHEEAYIFYVRVKDGVRLWIGDLATPIVDAWAAQPQALEHASLPVPLTAGQLYPITLEYFAAGPDATIELRWSSLSTPKAVVPQSHVYSGTTFVPIDGLVQTYESVYKAALVVRGFEATPREAEFLFTHGADFGGLDPNAWPIDRVDAAVVDAAAPTLFRQWEWVRDFFVVRGALPAREITLVDVLGAPTEDEARARLAEMTGWDAAAIEFLAGAGGLALPAASFRTAAGYARLLAAFTLARRLGIAIARLHAWAHAVPDPAQAREIVQSVKANYADTEWAAAAKPLNDALRERQRTALVAYVLALPATVSRSIANAEQLFEYFLIDVSMGACMNTSRLKQAISSVQMFVNRCLMGLEQKQPLDQAPGVTPDMIDEHRWDWMRNYRVWEANRKIFLRPEYYIEAGLRDDRTPFFRELEAQLLQQEITPDSVEQAFRDYLHKLDEVARLEICAVYPEAENDSRRPSVVHVFGRTRNTPHAYYYRRFLVHVRVWTAWERVALDIQSEHLVPVVFNRRLYLCWATFENKPDPTQDLSGPSVVPPKTAAEIEYENCLKAQDEFPAKFAQWEEDKKVFEAIMQLQGQSSFYDVPQPVKPVCTPPPPAPPLTPKEPEGQWEIKVSWSEYRRPPGPPTLTTEHRAGRWAPRQTTKTTRVSRKYELDGKTHFPSLDDHVFTAEIGADLSVVCWRRLADSPDPDTSDRVKRIGSFRIPGCSNAGSVILAPKSGPQERRTPEHSRIAGMRFDQLIFGGTLTFCGAEPEATEHDVLGNTPTLYEVVHPATDIEPEANTFASTIYTFAYQDFRRTYLGVPVLDEEQPQRAVVQFKPSMQIDVTDALTSKFKYIDKGDPGPEVVTSVARVGHRGKLEYASGFRQLLAGGAAAEALFDDATPMMLKSGSTGVGSSSEAAPALSATAMASDLLKKLKTYLQFHTLYHPHVCDFLRALNKDGVDGLLTLDIQRLTHDPSTLTLFREAYEPSADVHPTYPTADVDFGHPYGSGGAYTVYNWEVFFHIPLLIAELLGQNQRCAEAQKWFHYIFNPMTSSKDPSPIRYWNTLPFHENAHPEHEQIVTLLMGLHSSSKAVREAIKFQIGQWRDNPFNPHLIARLRLTAYQKATVIKYIDNLIIWGDILFSRDTIESINEATQLYVLAHHLLEPWPQHIPPRGTIEPKTYAELKNQLDAFSNALVTLENEFPFSSVGSGSSSDDGNSDGLGTAPTFYFCIPASEELQQRRDRVTDRLLKIRSCMNIEGVVRELPLFEPPIDPALLVKATAMGLDIGSVLNDVNAPLPPYRFQILLRQAFELCAEVKSLGAALLAALEKGDGEALAAVRSSHESTMLQMFRDVKRGQLQDAEAAIAALELTRDTTESRRRHYADLLKNDLIAAEKTQVRKLVEAHAKQGTVTFWELAAQAASNIPDATLGTSGGMSSPVVTATFGGRNAFGNAQAFARYLSGDASDLTFQATLSEMEAGYQRRAQEWTIQKTLAEKELLQIDKQILGAQIRAAVGVKEVTNHDQQVEHAAQIEELLRAKYTNQELYGWMQSQLSAVFFQTYKLAYDVAKRAERAFRFERGLTSSNYIQFGYWDSIRRGLLSGERLFLDLKRMEVAYTDGNRREYEITKQISLLQTDARALVMLRELGVCEFGVTELLLDDDYPGHIMRRVKNIALTIPCVVGPYVGINCTLTMLSNRVRVDGTSQMPYYIDGEDSRFVTNFAAIQSTATSHARNDAAMFEVNFRDDRYLPYEGAGAETRWRLEMPRECNAFDFSTISDVILTLNYTARDGGKLLAQKAREAVIVPAREGLQRLFNLHHEFPNEWYQLLHPTSGPPATALDLGVDRFPFRYRTRSIEIAEMELFVKPRNADAADIPFEFSLTAPGDDPDAEANPIELSGTLGSLRTGSQGHSGTGPGTWMLSVTPTGSSSLADSVGDIAILCRYSVSAL